MALVKPDMIPDEVVKVLTMLLLGRALNDKNVSIAIAAALSAWPDAKAWPGMQRGFKETPPFITLPQSAAPQKEGDA